MPTVRGKAAVRAYMAGIPAKMEPVIRGAARAGGRVFAEYVKENTPSEDVRDDVRIRTKVENDHVRVTVDVKPGWGRSVGTWLEWGTAGHFISVDDGQRSGRSIGRINQQVKDEGGNASLVIGGNFVGKAVWHPGAQPHPVFRPARDLKATEAIAAAQGYINTRAARAGIVGAAEGDDA